MISIFSSIRIAPGVTGYHRKVMDDVFRERLFLYLEQNLLPQVEEPFDLVTGSLGAEYGEEKFCSETSLIRDFYYLEVSFIRQGSTDDLKTSLCYDPQIQQFSQRSKSYPLKLGTRRRKENQTALKEKVNEVVTRILKKDKSSAKCAVCSTELNIYDRPDDIFISCPKQCMRVQYHLDPSTGEILHGNTYVKLPTD